MKKLDIIEAKSYSNNGIWDYFVRKAPVFLVAGVIPDGWITWQKQRKQGHSSGMPVSHPQEKRFVINTKEFF